MTQPVHDPIERRPIEMRHSNPTSRNLMRTIVGAALGVVMSLAFWALLFGFAIFSDSAIWKGILFISAILLPIIFVVFGVIIAHKRNNIRRWLLVSSSILLLVFVGVSWFAGGVLIAPASRLVGPPPDDMSVESIKISSDSGSSLAVWFIPSENATATVILLHPIRSDRRSMLGRARLLHACGYSTILVDLQAHGESPGQHITAGYLERLDVVAVVNFVRTRNPNNKIGIIGWSLGGAATLLAAPLEIDALVLESVYPTIEDAVHNRVSMRLGPLHFVLAPVLLAQLKPRLGISYTQLRPIDRIANVSCPVLVASGDIDLHTPLAETERLYNAAQDPKRLVIFRDAAHTDLLNFDPQKYFSDVVGFLDRHLQPVQTNAEFRQ